MENTATTNANGNETMIIAVITGQHVLEVTSNEAASLEGMAAYAALGYRRLRRLVVDEAAYVAYANGETLTTDLEVVDGVARSIVVAK